MARKFPGDKLTHAPTSRHETKANIVKTNTMIVQLKQQNTVKHKQHKNTNGLTTAIKSYELAKTLLLHILWI